MKLSITRVVKNFISKNLSASAALPTAATLAMTVVFAAGISGCGKNVKQGSVASADLNRAGDADQFNPEPAPSSSVLPDFPGTTPTKPSPNLAFESTRVDLCARGELGMGYDLHKKSFREKSCVSGREMNETFTAPERHYRYEIGRSGDRLHLKVLLKAVVSTKSFDPSVARELCHPAGSSRLAKKCGSHFVSSVDEGHVIVLDKWFLLRDPADQISPNLIPIFESGSGESDHAYFEYLLGDVVGFTDGFEQVDPSSPHFFMSVQPGTRLSVSSIMQELEETLVRLTNEKAKTHTVSCNLEELNLSK